MLDIIFGSIISIAFIVYLGGLIWALNDSRPKDNNPWKLIRTDVLPSGYEQIAKKSGYELTVKGMGEEFFQKKIIYVWKHTLTSEIKTEQISLFDK